MKATTPIFELTKWGYTAAFDGGRVHLCSDEFAVHALPNWTGPLPYSIRFHVRESEKGKWEWDRYRIFAELQTTDNRFVCTDVGLDDWLEKTFQTDGFRFNVTMEIIEP